MTPLEISQLPNGAHPVDQPLPHCCEGQDCCAEGETYFNHLSRCCVPGSTFSIGDIEYHCCPPGDNFCNNLNPKCQPASNTHCCDIDEDFCVHSNQCQEIGAPCCPHSQPACPKRDNQCLEHCCEKDEDWCGRANRCIPKDTPCCDFDNEEICPADNKCHHLSEHCCEAPEQWCEQADDSIPVDLTHNPHKKCREHCCDENNGQFWCENGQECKSLDRCCDEGFVYCEYQQQCQPEEDPCCPFDWDLCPFDVFNDGYDGCAPHCCDPTLG